MTPAKEILIVDDEVGIRELLSEILQDEGYRVSLAENATAARAYRARERPALVLLDIWMPDTDGVTLLREWAASGQLTMPVIMMSGHGTIETAVEATKIGVTSSRSRSACSLGGGAVALAGARRYRGEQARVWRCATSSGRWNGFAEALLIPTSPARGTTWRRALHASIRPGRFRRRAARPTRSVLEEIRDGTLCSEIGQQGKAGNAGLLPAASSTARHPRLHEHGTARQHGRGEQVRRSAAGGAVGRRGAASSAARAARGHPGVDRAVLARRRRAGKERAAAHGARLRDAAADRAQSALGRLLAW
jgi:CheY-like chemotaxis protein